MNLLSIGGSDPSAGAGIQSDIKLFANMDVNVLQSLQQLQVKIRQNLEAVEPVSIKILKNQLIQFFQILKSM